MSDAKELLEALLAVSDGVDGATVELQQPLPLLVLE